MTQESVNIAQKAHIHSFSADGPRGFSRQRDSLHSFENLLLVCHECHRKIDDKLDGGRYSTALLQAMKAEHESRIELVSGIDARRRSHVLLYGANIGDHSSSLSYREAAPALFPDRYPASDLPIDLGMANSSFVDREPAFWAVEARNLETKFRQRVRERLATREIQHLSVFALAPQPLLILLGTLLGDIVPSDIYQRHREPPAWVWPDTTTRVDYEVHRPAAKTGPPALVIALSATIVPSRILAVLGDNASIWMLTVATPHNDLVKSRADLAELRSVLRLLFDQIKAVHGETTTLHVFPACAASAAVEFGRVRMPKADMPWTIYDEVKARGGFIPALSIPTGVAE